MSLRLTQKLILGRLSRDVILYEQQNFLGTACLEVFLMCRRDL